MDDQRDYKQQFVTNRDLQLELKGLRGDVKVWILAAVAMNQFLSNVQLPAAVTVPAITAAILLPAAKALFFGRL